MQFRSSFNEDSIISLVLFGSDKYHEESSIVIEGTSTLFYFFKYPQLTNFLHI